MVGCLRLGWILLGCTDDIHVISIPVPFAVIADVFSFLFTVKGGYVPFCSRVWMELTGPVPIPRITGRRWRM